jgi:putative transposase
LDQIDQGAFLPRLAPRRADLGQRLRKRERGIWQRRYWEHTLRDEDDFARHVDYIHFNPVKHGHVERAQDWPFSSFRRMVRRGFYPEHWAGGPEKLEGGFGER